MNQTLLVSIAGCAAIRAGNAVTRTLVETVLDAGALDFQLAHELVIAHMIRSYAFVAGMQTSDMLTRVKRGMEPIDSVLAEPKLKAVPR